MAQLKTWLDPPTRTRISFSWSGEVATSKKMIGSIDYQHRFLYMLRTYAVYFSWILDIYGPLTEPFRKKESDKKGRDGRSNNCNPKIPLTIFPLSTILKPNIVSESQERRWFLFLLFIKEWSERVIKIGETTRIPWVIWVQMHNGPVLDLCSNFFWATLVKKLQIASEQLYEDNLDLSGHGVTIKEKKQFTLASFRTNWIPCPGYTVEEQNQHFSNLIMLLF